MICSPIKLISNKPKITQIELATLLNVTDRTIRNHIKLLLDNKYIKRVGADRNGKWIVLK